MVPISANICCLVVNFVSSCGKHNTLNAYTTRLVIKYSYFIGPDVSVLIELNSLHVYTYIY